MLSLIIRSVYILFGLISLFVVAFIDTGLSNESYAVLYCLLHSFSIYIIWITSGKKIEIFLLFMITTGLFIGGRFYATLFGLDFDIFTMDFFMTLTENTQGRQTLMLYVLSFVYFSTLGYLISYVWRIKTIFSPILSENYLSIFNQIALILFPFFFCITIYTTFITFRMVASHGYLALYNAQAEEYSSGGGMFGVFLQFIFAICIAYGNKRNKIAYILIFIISSTMSIIMGTRAAFGALLLFFLWLYGQYKVINLKKLILFGAIAVILLLVVFSFSIRAVSSTVSEVTLLQGIGVFLYAQGISLMVFDFSLMINDYPVLPYIQSIIPASSLFYSIFSGEVLLPWDVSFASYLSYSINPTRFLNGNGLGWTLMSDLYLYGGQSLIGFYILSLFFGWMVGNLENWASNNKFYLFLEAMIIFPFLILPRSGLNTIIPLSIYAFILFMLLYFITQVFVKLKKNVSQN